MDSDTDNVESQPAPRDKAELMERIHREWDALERSIAGLSDAQMSAPDAGGWSAKDNLAHLTAWEQFMLRRHVQGGPAHEAMQVDEATMAQAGEDGLNDIIFRRNRDRPVSEVLADARRSHQQVLDTLEQMSYADLTKPRVFDDAQARPLIGWVIGDTYEHYREHGANIRALAKPTQT